MVFMGNIPALANKSATAIFDAMSSAPALIDGNVVITEPWIKLINGEIFALSRDGPFLPSSIRCQAVSNSDEAVIGTSTVIARPQQWIDVIVVGATLSPRIVEVSGAAGVDSTKKIVKAPTLDR